MRKAEGVALGQTGSDGVRRDIDADGVIASAGQHDRQPAHAAAEFGDTTGRITEEVEDRGNVTEIEVALVVREWLAEGVVVPAPTDARIVFAFALFRIGMGRISGHVGFQTRIPDKKQRIFQGNAGGRPHSVPFEQTSCSIILGFEK